MVLNGLAPSPSPFATEIRRLLNEAGEKKHERTTFSTQSFDIATTPEVPR